MKKEAKREQADAVDARVKRKCRRRENNSECTSGKAREGGGGGVEDSRKERVSGTGGRVGLHWSLLLPPFAVRVWAWQTDRPLRVLKRRLKLQMGATTPASRSLTRHRTRCSTSVRVGLTASSPSHLILSDIAVHCRVPFVRPPEQEFPTVGIPSRLCHRQPQIAPLSTAGPLTISAQICCAVRNTLSGGWRLQRPLSWPAGIPVSRQGNTTAHSSCQMILPATICANARRELPDLCFTLAAICVSHVLYFVALALAIFIPMEKRQRTSGPGAMRWVSMATFSGSFRARRCSSSRYLHGPLLLRTL